MKASELIKALEEGYAIGKKIPDHGLICIWEDNGLNSGMDGGRSLPTGFTIQDCLSDVFSEPDNWVIGTWKNANFRRRQKTMTVRDLMAILVDCNPSDPVIASRDPEGNGYSRVWTVAEVVWKPDWAEVLDTENEEVDGLPEGAENAVCIWPR